MIVKLNFLEFFCIFDQLFIQHQLLVDNINTKVMLVMVCGKYEVEKDSR